MVGQARRPLEQDISPSVQHSTWTAQFEEEADVSARNFPGSQTLSHPLEQDSVEKAAIEDMVGSSSSRGPALSSEETMAVKQSRVPLYGPDSGIGHSMASEAEAETSRSWAAGQNRLDTGPRRPAFLARHPRSMRMASEASLGTGLEGSLYEGVEGNEAPWRATAEGSTPLDRTIDAIGMGRYQYAVLILSGFGWAADNMWLQGVAISLPRIQDEWAIGDRWIGLVSSSTFAGMMIGALAWGSYSDTFGRKNAFNITLLITAIFGLLASFAPNFPALCLCLFLLGTGVGGSMPTDGTIFLEAVPKRSHYLLTALSVFFAAGSVVASLLAFLLVPRFSCGGVVPCASNDNRGWRYLMTGLGGLTLLFVVARLVFFTLFESPKFLVSAGKHEEARAVLQRIAAFNGDPKRVHLSDVSDLRVDQQPPQAPTSRPSFAARVRSEIFSSPRTSIERQRIRQSRTSTDNRVSTDRWQETDDVERRALISNGEDEEDDMAGSSVRRHSFGGHEHQHESGWPAVAEEPGHGVLSRLMRLLPASWHPSLRENGARYAELFTPHWRKTTILVWSIWTLFTLAYTMVNVFLPKYLESRTGTPANMMAEPLAPSTDPVQRREAMEKVMRQFLFYSLSSLPGSLLGAYLIETPLGRIRSMALSTVLLALSLLGFAMARAAWTVVVTSCSISLFASVAYAVIYSYSPEVFKTSLRGTASGTASALSRLAGILAPVLAGLLLPIDVNLPLYLGFALFGVTVWLQISLPYETRGRDTVEEEG